MFSLARKLHQIWVRDGEEPGKSNADAAVPEDMNMGTVDAFFAPETLQGPYADFYRRAMTELLCWRMLRDGSDHIADVTQEAVDPLAFDALGIQLGQA